MSTKAGTGYSAAEGATEAGRAAAEAAIASMGGGGADLVLAFASTGYPYSELLGAIRGVTGAAPLIGCSGAGQFTGDDIGQRSVVVMTIKSDTIKFQTALGQGLRSDRAGAVGHAFSAFAEKHRAARAEGLQHATCILCTDGLAGNGEDLVEAVHAATGMLAQVVGGAAADDAQFERTDVFFDGAHHTDAMVVVYAFSKSPIGLGVRHGLNPACPSMIVTRATGNVIHEIDGQPAVAAYEKFAKSTGADFTADNRETFMITHEIGMLMPSGEYKVRAPLKANDDGSLVMASEVPSGASVSIMAGTNDGLVAAAKEAARSAMSNLGGARPAAVIAFDCICRRIFLGDHYRQQVDAFKSVVGEGVPVIGWETYGEIAMTPSQHSGWHNSTTVLAILPE